MKKWMIFGCLVGFLAGGSSSLMQGNSPAYVLFCATVAALGVGVMVRWWAKVLFFNLQDALVQRAAALQAEQDAASQKQSQAKSKQ